MQFCEQLNFLNLLEQQVQQFDMANNKWKTCDEYVGMQGGETVGFSGHSGGLHDISQHHKWSKTGNQNTFKLAEISSDVQQRSVSTLCDSLFALGVSADPQGDLFECSESVLSLIWKVISECNRRSKAWDAEKEKLARFENDNKLLKARLKKLSEDLVKSRSEMDSLGVEYRRKEAILQKQLDEVGKNRLEWEKAALSYKGREQKFVAEVRRHENDYEKLRDKMQRSLSMSGHRGGRVVRCPPLLPEEESFAFAQPF